MKKYVFYVRDDEGHIKRLSNLITAPPEGLMGAYTYEEQLTNFPEATVFWAGKSGPSVGIASLAPKKQAYIPYVRTSEGYIERVAHAISSYSDNDLVNFPYEEVLVGWPEARVFWAKPSGASVGVAPTSSPPAN